MEHLCAVFKLYLTEETRTQLHEEEAIALTLTAWPIDTAEFMNININKNKVRNTNTKYKYEIQI